MKCFYLLTSLLLTCIMGATAQQGPVTRVVLVGGPCNKSVLNAIKQFVPLETGTTILLLGDNLSEDGGKMQWEGLDAQAALVEGTDAKAIFIPGNREWDNGKLGG